MMRNIPFGKPLIGDEEKRAVMEVLNNPILVHGPKSKEFETAFANYTEAPHAISVSSCTAALHLSYFYLSLNKGDEVIVPAQTHTATAHAVELMGAKPVFVDAEKVTGNIDIEQIEPAITERTKAISIVHYLGMPVDMDRIMEIAKKHDLFVVEDCALAVGSYYKGVHVGLHGDVGCFSFYPIKHITTAEGGMLITKDDKIAASVERQRAFGVDRHHAGERKVPGVYDVTQLGFNYRMSEVHASIGIEQLKKMNAFLEKRKLNYETLTAGLQEINEISLFKSTHGNFQSSYYCHSILLNDSIMAKRFEIVDYLKRNGVGTSVYYPQVVPQMT
ncbi:DegT/DnrJ/EryC1/StrS family aminotransferase, partial [bacterium]|nr:DegT/DnrJ/EryC1/StrS family aminotransferase [bacterium]